jgi:hypothetical protein
MGIDAHETLRREYPGDEAWASFVAAFKPASAEYRRAQASALIPADVEMAETLIAILGHDPALDWIDRPIDTLDGRSPADVMANDPDGIRIVRHVLMRLPI